MEEHERNAINRKRIPTADLPLIAIGRDTSESIRVATEIESHRYRRIVSIIDAWLSGEPGEDGRQISDGAFLHAINAVIGEEV